MKIFVFYHDYGANRCFDGTTAMYYARKHFNELDLDVEFYPIQYGVKFPVDLKILKDSVVYFLDIVLQQEQASLMKAIWRVCKKLIIIDHHESAIPVIQELQSSEIDSLQVVFDKQRSGGYLACSYFNHGKDIPELAKVVDRTDRWDSPEPWMLAVAAYFHEHCPPVTDPGQFKWMENFEQLVQNHDHESHACAQIILEGQILISIRKRAVERYCATAKPIVLRLEEREVHGYVAFAPQDLASSLGEALALKTVGGGGFGMVLVAMFDTQGKYRIKGSIRTSQKDPKAPSAIELAQLFGGGGHYNAAGFWLSPEEAADFLYC